MGVTTHPDQFCVLNSERPDVVQSSIRMLAAEARVMDAMGLQRSPWAGINVHGGARDRMAELRAAVDALPDAVRSRLTLENCERAYSVPDLRAVGVPVVFDPHHEVVRGFLTGLWRSDIVTFGAQIGERARGQRVRADFNERERGPGQRRPTRDQAAEVRLVQVVAPSVLT